MPAPARLLALALCLGALAAIPADDAAAAKGAAAIARGKVIAQGKAVARLACASCHQIEIGQAEPPPVFIPRHGIEVLAPSFMALAIDCDRDAATLRRAVAIPHFSDKQQAYLTEELDALAAYILSLRPAKACVKRRGR